MIFVVGFRTASLYTILFCELLTCLINTVY